MSLDRERYIKKLNRNELGAIWSELKLQAGILGTMIAGMWAAHYVNWELLNNWVGSNLALKARSLDGLLGILITPFINIHVPQLMLSSLLVLVLGWWVMLRDTRDFFIVHLSSMLSAGVLMWLFEPSIARWYGWGGIAFGMAGYLLTGGLFERRWPMILSSLVAMATIGTTVATQLIPGVPNSWWGLFGGFIGGVFSAAFLGWRRRKQENPENYLGAKMPSVGELSGIGESTTASGTVLDFESSTTVGRSSSSASTSTQESEVSSKA